MRMALFEDRIADDLRPLTWLRPVFELLCGQFSARERMFRLAPITAWGAWVRELLVETYREEHPEAHVNQAGWFREAPTLLLNGRWLPDASTLVDLPANTVGVIDGTIAWITLDPTETPLLELDQWEDALYRLARSRTRVEAGGKLLARPWDLVNLNPEQLVADFHLSKHAALPAVDSRVALLGPPERISIDPAARLEPFVVIDARGGPVSIAAGAVIQSFTRIEGPCHVGRQAQLFRANVRGGTTIGPVCRVGGEIEASILHGYVNKYHDGFLGHSYVCPWVNLGALTTNSDLKNDYSAVRIPLEGTPLDTGLTKVGCFIGDHTKTGLGSLFNTGSSIGVMCMVLPAGELLPKYVPPFASVWHGELANVFPLDRSLAAAEIAMERRGCELTPAAQRLLRTIHAMTQAERDALAGRPTVPTKQQA